MFQKVLIANRGEIVLRVLRACRELGIRTVTVHSEADAGAPHAHMADETYLVGPAPVAQSYLKADAILEVARKSGADAVHPGYGLLSENADFARACAAAGVTFIGPSPDVIAAMGVKTRAREIMRAAGVPVVPGGDTALPDADAAVAAAEAMGWPVMLKAAAGGGGIGMQRCEDAEALRKAFGACAARAKAYFGDPAMYVEKCLEAPRHVEVQVLCDAHGRRVHLNERECSIQRRHQKVLEEAGSPAVDERLRAEMGRVATAACEAIGYTNAGTLEFLLDRDGKFYFLEMNTRLQVEHPVTELITGVDLVHWQLRIAAGEPLTLRQEDLAPRGHALEVRLYAEDPVTFFPAPGTLQRVALPEGEGVRVDGWIADGTVVTPHYDPLLAKITTWGEDRAGAIARMRAALAATEVTGTKTNLPLLRRVVEHPAFAAGELSTDFLAKHAADLTPPAPAPAGTTA